MSSTAPSGPSSNPSPNHPKALALMLGAVGVVGLLLFLGLYFGIQIGRALQTPKAPAPPRIQDSATVVRQIQTLSQLVSVKYVIEKVVVVEDAKWFGENRLIMVVRGVAKAGFELDRLSPSAVKIDGSTIEFTLPRPVLTDVYLDEKRTEVIERSTGLLRSMDRDLETDARRQAVDRIKVAAIEAGILKEAEDRARGTITQAAQALGYSQVELRVK